MKRIVIFTNEVAGGWCPSDIEQFLGGSEECVTLLAQGLVAAGYDVDVYHSQREGCSDGMYGGAFFYGRQTCQIPDPENTILITFKTHEPWDGGANCWRNVHISSDVESPWNVGVLHHFVHISNFHETQHIWMPDAISRVIPWGADLARLDRNKTAKMPGTVLYCSSPDRGLYALLANWPLIKSYTPELKLKIAYGFRNFNLMGGNREMVKALSDMMMQDGVEFIGELTADVLAQWYHRSEYWCLPLNYPQSELFCLNAVKSRYCGCTPVVNRIGALRDTVGEHIVYTDFVQGDLKITEAPAAFDAMPWHDVIEKYWLPILN
jgi:hypothetical protein